MPTLEPVFKPFARRFALALVLVFLAKISLPNAQAQTNYWWDSNDSAAGFGTAQGTWAAPTTNNATQGWTTDNTGSTTMSGSTTTANDNINFGTSSNQLGTGTITVSGNVSARLINFTGSSSNITLSGGNITLGTSSAITVTNSANTSAITETISSNITLGASPTWSVNNGGTVGTATLDVSGNVTGGSYGLTKSGNGTLTLSGAANTWNGTTTVSGGTLTLSGSLTTNGSIAVNGAANPVLNITGNLTQTLTGNNRNFVIAGSSNSYGTVNVSGSGILNIGGGMLISEDSGGNGVFNQSGGTVNANGNVWLGGQSSSLSVSGGNFNMGGSTLLLGSGSPVSSNATLSVSGTGTVSLGTMNVGAYSRNFSAITVNLGNGTVGGNLSIAGMAYGGGASAGPVTFNFNGGTLHVRGSTSMVTTNTTTIVKSGGAIIDVNSGQTFTISSNLTTDGTGGGLTKNGTGTLTLSGAGNTYTGGTTINAGTLTTSTAAGLGNGTAAVNGGALTINYGAGAFTFTNNLTGNGTVNLTAANAGGTTIPVFRPVSMSGFNGTVTIDTGFNNIYYQINPNSGSTFDGSAAKWVVNNQNANSFVYTTASLVKYGELSGNGKVSAANANTTLEVGALGTNSTFSGILLNNTFGGTLAFTKVGTGTLTLTGVNTYTGVTTISAGTLQIGTGTTGSIDNTSSIVNNGDLIFNKNSDFTIKGMTGTGNLTVNATSNGFITLGGNITQSGTVSISTLTTLANSAGLRQTNNTTITASSISITGQLGSNGAGSDSKVLTLDTSSTNGSILLDFYNGSSGRTATAAASIVANAGTGNVTVGAQAGRFSESGAWQPASLTGGINITAAFAQGALSVNTLTLNATAASTISSNLTFSANTTNNWTVSPGVTMSVSGRLAGSNASITKAGNGTLTLSNAANTYNGTTTINAGTLNVTGSTASSAMSIASGATLTGTGTVGAITLNTGGLVGAGTGTATVGKLTGSSLSIGSSSGYAFTIGNVNTSVAGTDYDQISLSGALTFSNTAANPFTVYLYGTPTGWSNTGIYRWDLITGATSMDDFVAASFAADFTNFGIAEGSRNGTWSFSSPTDGTIRLTYSGSDGTSTWNTATGSWNTAAQWSENAIPVNNNSLLFTGSGGTATNNISNSTLTSVNNITFESGAGAYTLAATAGSAGASGGTALAVIGSITNNSTNLQTLNTAISLASSPIINAASGNITIGGVISGNGGITKSGANSLTLSTANTYSGGTALNAGTLNIGNATAIGTGTLTIASGTLDNTSGAAMTFSNNNAQNWNGNFTVAGTNDLNMGTGNVTLGATPTVTVSAGNLTVGGIISGSSRGLTKAGSGTMILTGNNTYTGTTTISAGTLQVGGSNGNIAGAIVNNANLLYTSGNFGIYGVTGSGNLTINQSSGNVFLQGNITQSGTVNITTSTATSKSGMIQTELGTYRTNRMNTSITASAITINGMIGAEADNTRILTLDTSASNGAITLDLQNGSSGTWNAVSIIANAGTGNFTLSGSKAGTANAPWTADNGNSFTGALNISSSFTSGNLTLNATGNSSVTGNLNFLAVGNAPRVTAIVNPGLSMTISGNITQAASNVASLTKNGTGTLILSGAANTYTGATTVNAGTLQLSGNISSSALTLNSGGIISVGTNASVAKYNASSITIGAGSGYIFTIGSNASGTTAGTDFDQVTATGALTFNNTAASRFTVYVNGSPTNWSNTGNYTWNIMSGASISGFNSGNFAVNTSSFGIASGNRTGTWSFATSGGNLTLSYTLATPDYFWDGGTGNWTDTYSAGVRGFTPANPTVDDNLYFSGSGGTVTNNMANSTISSVNFITFNSTAGAYTLAANATVPAAGTNSTIPLTVKGDITNNSNNTQTISMSLAFDASSSGIINTAAGNIILSGNITGSTGITKNGNGSLTLSGASLANTGNVTINAGNVTVSGGALNRNITVNSGATLIAGTNYVICQSGGILTINGGTFKAGNAATYIDGGLVLNNATITNTGGGGTYISSRGLWTANGNNTINMNISTETNNANGSNFNIQSGTTTINNSIYNYAGWYQGLTKNGTGTLVLNGANSYNGTTNLRAGTLVLNNNTALGAGSLSTLTIISGTLDVTSGSTITLTNNYTQSWNGDFAFLGTNGSLNVGTGAVTMNASRTVTVANSTFTVGGAIGGATFGLTKNGSGTLVLSGASTYNGTTTVNAGTITLGAADRIADTSNLNVAGGTFNLGGFNETLGSITGSGNITLSAGTLTTNSTSNTTFSGIISGTGGLTKNGTSTLTLTGNNSYNGTTTINTGTLLISSAGQLGGGNYSGNISNTGTFRYNSTANQTLGGIISGNGALVKNAASTLTLTGNNTFNGTTTITGGTLQISSTGLLGGGNYSANISNSGTLLIASNSNQTLGGVISGSGALTKNGTGTLTLTGSNNYSGNTTINTGTVVIGHANAAGTGKIFQTDGTSLLKIDTTGTITNAMSVYNVLATQSATLNGAITVNNATWDIETGDTLTISGVVSGNGGVTKTGGGTLVLSGNNTYLAPTVINAGTLNAANAGALGANNTVQVNGGTLLVSADDAINGMNITLNGTSTTVAGLAFSGNYSGLVDNLTLSKNSIIDLGEGSVSIMFDTIVMSTYMLDIYNWTGTTLWGGGTGNDTDKVYFGPDLSDAALEKIRFHSGAVGVGDSFLGSGYDLGLQATSWDPSLDGYHIIPVPEPETWATGILLVLGSGVWLWRKRSSLTTEFTEKREGSKRIRV